MLCTRWFLPLLILPVPIATPYFLVLFLVSLTFHARPCFYCVSLLAALFVSSCYWQPLPLGTHLSAPWGPNITTYSDALSSIMPSINKSDISLVRLNDRCWVDWSFGGFFEPYNLTQWEEISLFRMKDELEKRDKDTIGEDAAQEEAEHILAVLNGTSFLEEEEVAPSPEPEVEPQFDDAEPENDTLTTRITIASFIRSMYRKSASPPQSAPHPPPSPPEPISLTIDTPVQEATAAPLPLKAESVSDSPTKTIPPDTSLPPRNYVPWSELPWFRREYDLKPLGFDLILDFGWSRQPS
ncbi:hypothetical protein JAAARDRAFT_71624 [Jaapia argillacea MUCL 33604]|uniref:Uncharacterized protein n=1 Tax=Jaapia argillacea MUCL 33604 TaxID=933084 RepID=A0A067PU60_9AGAM|nr:hypothetical protein JAAARDRAFT_71624 [Jaapia argillacea MUCL 33604]